MSSFKINEVEEESLFDEPDHLYKLYTGIRRFMDFKTGIAGKSRRLSEEYFIERLSHSPRQGRKAYKCPREKVRTGLRNLEKIGLIKPLGNYVFECILATKDNSVQNKCNQSATIPITIGETKNNESNLLKNRNISKQVQPEVQQYYSARYNPPPVSGINNTIIYTPKEGFEPSETLAQTSLSDSSFNQFWKAWPNKKGKVVAQKIWKKKKLGKHIGDILADIDMRQKADYFADKDYVVHGSTYLSQERWRDEDKSGQVGKAMTSEIMDLPSAELMFAALAINPHPHPNSFASEIISCIPGFRSMGPQSAQKAFVDTYHQRLPIWSERRLKNQNAGKR